MPRLLWHGPVQLRLLPLLDVVHNLLFLLCQMIDLARQLPFRAVDIFVVAALLRNVLLLLLLWFIIIGKALLLRRDVIRRPAL